MENDLFLQRLVELTRPGQCGAMTQHLGVLLCVSYLTDTESPELRTAIWDVRSELGRQLQHLLTDDANAASAKQGIQVLLSFVTYDHELADFIVHEIFERAIYFSHHHNSQPAKRIVEWLWEIEADIPWLLEISYALNQEFFEADKLCFGKC